MKVLVLARAKVPHTAKQITSRADICEQFLVTSSLDSPAHV